MSENDPNRTQLQRRDQYQDRWTSFAEQTGILDLADQPTPSQLRSRSDLFRAYSDQMLFEICPDISIAKWKAGAVLFEEGTYIDLAFLIVEGEMEFFLEKRSQESRANIPFFDSQRTGMIRLDDFRKLEEAESGVEDRTRISGTLLTPPPPATPPAQTSTSSTQIMLLTNMDFNLPSEGQVILGPGDIFGEIGALNGWPQSATARTKTECSIIQIRLPALRKLRAKSKDFKEWIDRIYRERFLISHLKSTPLLSGCSETDLARLKVELVSYSRGQAIVEEGTPADAVYLVRSGFVKLLKSFADGRITVTYLSKGMTLGETELALDGIDDWRVTAVSVEHSELVRIESDEFLDFLQDRPWMKEDLWKAVLKRIKEVAEGLRDVSRSEFVDASLSNGLAQGSSVLLIDLNVCTRCDDCVKACAETHQGRTRFVREGDRYHNFLIARSCFHCQDPVCLIGCPTGSIRRAAFEDVVEIVDEICIGCSRCAAQCPYDAIVMHDTEETWPQDSLPKSLRGTPRSLASKCDLCYDTGHDPACVVNCPHGCAIRVGSVDDFLDLISGGED